MPMRHTVVFRMREWDTLHSHLFERPGEHGAVVSVGVARSPRGVRLLVRDVWPAKEGRDYVPDERGHRRLTAGYVRDRILAARDQNLGYLAVHNHGGDDSVSFSSVDMASHNRSYPALRDINSGRAIGALVLARSAVAGDLWMPDGFRVALDETLVVGRGLQRFYPALTKAPISLAQTHDRQVRLFGVTGQLLLSRSKVGLIGAGGAGSILAELLGRLGVGQVVVVDPDVAEPSNIPRLLGARWLDAPSIRARGPLAPLRPVTDRLARRKVRIARRVIRRANPKARVSTLAVDVTDPRAARELSDCDYLFLAADTMLARNLFNSLIHQYLIPGVQVGVKVPIDGEGRVGDVFAVARTVRPDEGCMWCNGLIDPTRLAEESATPEQRHAQRYIEELPAPSVITLNALAASWAANDFLFSLTGLHDDRARRAVDFYLYPRGDRASWNQPRRDTDCPDCGHVQQSRLAMGDDARLPTSIIWGEMSR